MAKSKTGRIEICDSKKRKGEYFVRIVAGNNEKLATGETLTTPQAVNKHLLALAGAFVVHAGNVESLFHTAQAIDRTKSQWWAKRYAIPHKPITR